MLGKKERVEGLIQPKRILVGHSCSTLVFACPARASVPPLTQTHLGFSCHAKTPTLAPPRQHSALKCSGHLSPISAPTLTFPDVPPRAEIAPWFRHGAGGAEPHLLPCAPEPKQTTQATG